MSGLYKDDGLEMTVDWWHQGIGCLFIVHVFTNIGLWISRVLLDRWSWNVRVKLEMMLLTSSIIRDFAEEALHGHCSGLLKQSYLWVNRVTLDSHPLMISHLVVTNGEETLNGFCLVPDTSIYLKSDHHQILSRNEILQQQWAKYRTIYQTHCSRLFLSTH